MPNPLLTLRKVTCLLLHPGHSQQQEVCEGEQSKNDPHAAENRDTPIASFIIIITIFVLCRVFLELPWIIGIFWKAELWESASGCAVPSLLNHVSSGLINSNLFSIREACDRSNHVIMILQPQK